MTYRHRACWLATGLLALAHVCPVSSLAGADEGSWMEILPFSNWRSRAISLSAESPVIVERAEEGAALICTGGPGSAITCEERFLSSDEPVELPDSELGVAIVGRVILDGEAAGDVEVSLALAELTARRPLLLPLRFRDGRIERQLVTDSKGRFATPPLAAASYRLELRRPGGRVELLDPFPVPAPDDLVEQVAAKESLEEPAPPRLDLGDLQVTSGLEVEVSMIDESGAPVAEAAVSASQGKPPGKVVMFQSRTNADGVAILRGFEPAGPIQATCSKRGFSRLELKFEEPPAWIHCVLRPLARLSGDVLSGGEGVGGATVSLPSRNLKTQTDSEGRFRFKDLDAGDYQLVVAAPGFEVAERGGALGPGEKGSVFVELEPAPLRWGRVIDAVTGELVSGARVVSLTPPGAVACTSNGEGELFFEAASHRPLTLEVSALGYPPHRVELKPEDGTEGEPWQVELAHGGRIAVTVWSSKVDGPCVGCDLSLFKEFDAGEPPPPDVSLRTGEDGRAETGDLPGGRYQIYLEEVSSIGSSVQVRSGHNLKLANVKPGTVTEVIFGAPRQTVEVRFRSLSSPGWKLRTTGPRGANLYSSQADGSFRQRRRSREVLALRLETGGVSIAQGFLKQESGDFIEIDLPRTLVAGRLAAGLEMAASSGLRVRSVFQNGPGAWVMPRPDGRFEIPYLLPGAYRIVLGDRDLATFNLASGKPLELSELQARPDSEM